MASPLPTTPDLVICPSATVPRPKYLPLFHAKAGVGQNAAGPVLQLAGSPNLSNKPAPGLLTSWKDISVYLNRGVRTVQRWEQTLGLPVHRMGVGTRAPVFSFKPEIDDWLQQNARTWPVNSGAPVCIPRAHLNPRRQWLMQFIQELRAIASELEQELAAEGLEPNANITSALLRIQKLVNTAFAGNQLAPIECPGQQAGRAHRNPAGRLVANPSAESMRFLD